MTRHAERKHTTSSNGAFPHRDDWNPVGPRGGARPVNTMNVLLTIGIFLQIYQIYQTPTHSGTTVQNFQPGSSSFYDFPRGLRRSFDYNLQNPLGQAQYLHDDGIGNTDLTEPMDPRRAEAMRNMLLFGNENGPDLGLMSDDVVGTLNNSNSNPDEAPFQPSKYNYSLPPNRTKFNLPTQPKPSNESNLVVIVLSARSNFERRQTIRETWAQNHTNVYFIIGGPEPDNLEDMDWNNTNSTSSRLFREQETYQDLLDTVHPDTYKALCYKLHYAIRWISQHPGMKHIQWILKADDDVVVRQNTLQYYVLRKHNPQIPIVIGRVEPNSRPWRAGKWAEDPKWEGIDGVDEYPPWAYGSTGYVMSRPVFDYVASEKSLYYYQGEDASLGIWLYESPLDVSWIDSPAFNLENQMWYNSQFSAVIGHDLGLEAMRRIFDRWKDPKQLESFVHKDHVRVKGIIYKSEQQINYDDPYDEWDSNYMMWEDWGEENSADNYVGHSRESISKSKSSSRSKNVRDHVGRLHERREERRAEKEKEWDNWARDNLNA